MTNWANATSNTDVCHKRGQEDKIVTLLIIQKLNNPHSYDFMRKMKRKHQMTSVQSDEIRDRVNL